MGMLDDVRDDIHLCCYYECKTSPTKTAEFERIRDAELAAIDRAEYCVRLLRLIAITEREAGYGDA